MNQCSFDIRHVADLARLAVSPEEMASLQQDLTTILDYMEHLNEVDISGIEPTAHAMALENVWREDRPAEPYGREVMLKNAPDLMPGELIRVPQVLPGEGSN